MYNVRSRFSAYGRTLEVIAFLLFLMVMSAETARTQPGDKYRTKEEIWSDLNQRLARANEWLSKNPDPYNYVARGDIYVEFSWRREGPLERLSYAEKALDDFNKAIARSPTYWVAFERRARLRRSKFLPNFEAVVADYLEAIRLAKAESEKGRFRGPDESPVPGYFHALASMYVERAESLLRDPNLIAQIQPGLKPYSPWDDFDTAALYMQKSFQKPEQVWILVDVLLRKGDAAFKLREYEIALEAYQRDEQYLGRNYSLICENAVSRWVCESDQRRVAMMFSLRRARVYLQLKQAEKALTDLDVFFTKSFHLECAEPFLLRARANHLLGRTEPALADESTASKLPDGACGN